MEGSNENDAKSFSHETRELTDQELLNMEKQNTRLVSEYQALKLETEAKKHWDLFYKRNETRFFKDRHWTTREFQELLDTEFNLEKKTVLEVGCGVGNVVYPLLEEGLNMFFYACDLSPRAIEFVKKHSLYNEENIKAFQSDITTDNLSKEILINSVDIATMIFVLSAVHPENFIKVLKNIYDVLKPGGIVLLRDYGLYDMAQLRFKEGRKISENFYMRQDGTRSYYFSKEFLGNLFTKAGYKIISNSYIHRRTVNRKENVDVPRIFVQGKFHKPT